MYFGLPFFFFSHPLHPSFLPHPFPTWDGAGAITEKGYGQRLAAHGGPNFRREPEGWEGQDTREKVASEHRPAGSLLAEAAARWGPGMCTG